MAPKERKQRRDIHARVGLVNNANIDGYVRSQHLSFGAIGCYAIHSRQ
jgi:hypothetical protein